MKALLLVGGQGTRLRPLTIHAPKSIVPIFNRPFLHYQLDLIKQVPEIDEVILSLNYQPHRIEEVFGDGSAAGIKLRYVVEPTPLGTAGAVRYAAQGVRDTLVVFNGDVLTQVDLRALIDFHRGRQARATIVLTPVDNPTAYGLVETDPEGNVERFVEKPNADEIRCDTINAGIYVLETETLDRIPKDTVYSIERGYFPSLVENKETFVAYTYRGYWIDIGTPEKYRQAHHDIMAGRFAAPPFADAPNSSHIAHDAKIEEGANIQGPCFIDSGAVVKAGATIGPYSVIGRQCHVGERAVIDDSILWPNTWVDSDARLRGTVAGRHAHFGRNVDIGGGTLFGDKSVITDYSKA